MFMELKGLLRQLTYLRTTVRMGHVKGAKAWLYFIYYALFRLNRFRILRIKVDEIKPAKVELPGISFSSLEADELDTFRNPDFPREFFCDRFHKVHNCCIARFDGVPAYIHWIYYRGDFSRFLKLGEDCAEINYVLTLPQYRGHGISTAAFSYSIQSLKEQGISNVFAVVHEENTASLKSFLKAGFRDVGSTCSFGLFNRKVSV